MTSPGVEAVGPLAPSESHVEVFGIGATALRALRFQRGQLSRLGTSATRLSLDYFGVRLQRTYSWFSIVGLAENVPSEEPWPPVDDGESANIQTAMCSSATSPGLAYQVLSIATGALRWPICRNDDFSAMFRAIATNVVQKASVSCDWGPPEG